MCEYCEKDYENKNMIDDENCTVTIINEKNEIEIDYAEYFSYNSRSYYGTFPINYCPICGKKLSNK